MSVKSNTTRKEFLIHEAHELFAIFLYLAASFSFLATIKSLILIQLGVNNFVHGYTVALIEALALGKIAMLAQKLPILSKPGQRSLALSSALQAAVMAVLLTIGGDLEEKIFAHHVAEAAIKHPVIVVMTHAIGLFFVFYVLFVIRGLDRAMGPGNLLGAFLSTSISPPIGSAKSLAKEPTHSPSA